MKKVFFGVIFIIFFLQSCNKNDIGVLEENINQVKSLSKTKKDSFLGSIPLLPKISYKIAKNSKMGVNALFINDELTTIDGIEFKIDNNTSGPLLVSKVAVSKSKDQTQVFYYDVYLLPRTKTFFDENNIYDLTNELKDKKDFKVIKIGTLEFGMGVFSNSFLIKGLDIKIDKKINDTVTKAEFVKIAPKLLLEEKIISLSDLKDF